MSDAEEALLALAHDLIEEISAGRAIELAQATPAPALPAPLAAAPKPKKGAGAVHPHLGRHLLVHPGDTLSGHVYVHAPRMFPVKPPAT